MAHYAIDAPTLLHLVVTQQPRHTDHQLVAPNAIRSQALSMLLTQVCHGEITEADALRLHERMTTLKMRLLGDRKSRRTAWDIAREHGWSSIDRAEYLAVAQLQADALVTVDAEMTALARGIVTLAPLDVLTG